jgi:Flp pilus assembly protein TadG
MRLLPRKAHSGSRGQGIVEFAIVLPLLLILFLAIADLARLYTTMMSVESAAREAADYGAFNSANWSTTPPSPTNEDKTLVEMERRACTAASDVLDYSEPTGTVNHATCTNPTFATQLCDPASAPTACNAPSVDCSDETLAVPCRVKVSLQHSFHLIVPLHLDFFGVQLGLPDHLDFTRESTFAVSDFEIDSP